MSVQPLYIWSVSLASLPMRRAGEKQGSCLTLRKRKFQLRIY